MGTAKHTVPTQKIGSLQVQSAIKPNDLAGVQSRQKPVWGKPMTLAGKKLTFEEYLALDDTGLEGRAELVDGELIGLPPESGFNADIATLLQVALIQIGISYQFVHMGRCEVQTPVLQPKDAANRFLI